MSIMKFVVILLLVNILAVSARSHHKHQKKHHKKHHRAAHGRADEPESIPHEDVIDKHLEIADEHKNLLAIPEALTHKEIAKESEKLQKHLTVAMVASAIHPEANDNKLDLALEKAKGHHDALSHHLEEAESHHEILKKEGKYDLTNNETVQHHEALQHHLGLAHFHAIEHKVATDEIKGEVEKSEVLATNVAAVAAVAQQDPALAGAIVQGRGMPRGRSMSQARDELAISDVTKVFADFGQLTAEVKRRALELPGVNENDINGPVIVLDAQHQIVAGMNYFVKLRVGQLIFHVRVARGLDDVYIIQAVQGPMEEGDRLTFIAK